MATIKIPIGKFPITTNVITVAYDVENGVIINQETIFERIKGIPYDKILFEVVWNEIGSDDVFCQYLHYNTFETNANVGENYDTYYYYTYQNYDYYLTIKYESTNSISFGNIHKLADNATYATYASQDTSKGTIEQRLAALEALLNN